MAQWTAEQERVLSSDPAVLGLRQKTLQLLKDRLGVARVRDVLKHVDKLDEAHPREYREILCALEADGFFVVTTKQQQLLEESISLLGMSVRTTNTLEEKGVFTIRQLLYCPESDLRKTANVGDKTIDEIYKALANVGFYRAGKRPLVEDEVAERRRCMRADFGFTD